ncbi:GH32 C-terminal domain-containing protein [Paenibacillus sp. Soil787]|uniref:GH32 C-terminal domain-containing protein n=1 Tax=Paenibacillus sp. Soil787 TaxID=1736411 RepID=UPI000702439E|nr:GH32 C-terminal domain-containing protein [Paenibacillus sp. Soil787]KRF13640.1 hypothetical protein ASG93_14085 [Paenibacillus sp. Soil787]
MKIGIKWMLKVLLMLVVSSAASLGVTTAYASSFNSNMPGYTPISGTWSIQSGSGVKGVSTANTNAFAMSTTTSGTNFAYEADVTVDSASAFGVGSLVFRASEDGTNGYVVSIDPNLDRVRLFDYATGSDVGTPYATMINTGTAYHLKVTADGPQIKVYLGSVLAISVSDMKYSTGILGYHVYNGTAYFQNAFQYETTTNVTGWNVTSGTWTPTTQGWRGTASSGQNAYAISSTSSDNFTYEADVLIEDTYAVSTLLFRTNASATQGYGLQMDPNLDRLRLFNISDDVTLGTQTVTLDTGKVYHVKVKAEGTVLKFYLQTNYLQADGYDPILTVTNSTYSSGFVGLNVYNGSAKFQKILISDANTNLAGWTAINGKWTPHLDGVKAVSSGAADTFRIASNTASDFVLEGDLKVDTGSPFATAGLLFRANANASSGYVLNIDPNLDQIRLFNAGTGTTIAASARTIDTGKTYHVEITANGSSIKVYVDGYATLAINATDGSYSSGQIGLNTYNGTAYFQNVTLTDLSAYSNEMYRPGYHYTQEASKASDPNGLVYYEGEYHLFHQDEGRWGHAVSTDLTHWKRLPIALPFNDLGNAWSGSAVVDTNNVTGLFGGGSGLVAFYTNYDPDKVGGNQQISLAYSTDNGRTWLQYSANPIVQNPGGVNGGWDFRDPKVVWDSDHNEWVMVVSGGDNIRFYTSTDLLTWTYTSSFGFGAYLHGGTWECPDFFQLGVDGGATNKKWVLSISTGPATQTNGSSSEYFVGSFDGSAFTSDNPANTVLRSEYGKDMYAAMAFSDIPSNARRIEIGWMSNWEHPFSEPTFPFHGQLSIPRELTLVTNPEGVRLAQKPVTEMNNLRGTATTFNNITITPTSTNLLSGLSGNAYEIDADFLIPTSGAASEFGLSLRELGSQKTVVGYLPPSSKMFVDRVNAGRTDFTAHFASRNDVVVTPVSNHVKMHIYVDESSVEVFGNDGKVVFSDIILPDSARDGLNFYSTGGNVTVLTMSVYSLANTWRTEPTSGTVPQKVVMDKPKMEIGVGSTQQLYTTVLPHTATNKNLTWSSSNTAIATVSTMDARSADVTGISPGRAVITATTQIGSIVGTMVVQVGSAFSTNLTGWTSTNQAEWIPTADGIAGYFDLDSNYMSTITGGNFTYEADMKLDTLGGAGSIIFRGDATGSNGYYFNVDPSLKTLRLLYKLNGSFTSSQIIASVPMLLQSGKAYHVKIVTSGTNIKIYFDGGSMPVIDVNDEHFSSGIFGLNLFGGRAYYQNVTWASN